MRVRQWMIGASLLGLLVNYTPRAVLGSSPPIFTTQFVTILNSPTPVTIRVTNADRRHAIEDVLAQAELPPPYFEPDDGRRSPPVTIDLSGRPFWSALFELARPVDAWCYQDVAADDAAPPRLSVSFDSHATGVTVQSGAFLFELRALAAFPDVIVPPSTQPNFSAPGWPRSRFVSLMIDTYIDPTQRIVSVKPPVIESIRDQEDKPAAIAPFPDPDHIQEPTRDDLRMLTPATFSYPLERQPPPYSVFEKLDSHAPPAYRLHVVGHGRFYCVQKMLRVKVEHLSKAVGQPLDAGPIIIQFGKIQRIDAGWSVPMRIRRVDLPHDAWQRLGGYRGLSLTATDNLGRSPHLASATGSSTQDEKEISFDDAFICQWPGEKSVAFEPDALQVDVPLVMKWIDVPFDAADIASPG